MGVKFVPTDEQLAHIKELAAAGETMSTIAFYIKKDRCCVKRLLQDYSIELNPSAKNKMGKKFNWNSYNMRQLENMYNSEDFEIADIVQFFETSEGTIVRKAKELGLKKVPKRFFNDEELAYLRRNAGKKTLAKMSEDLGKNDWVIGKQLTKMGILVRLGKRVLPPESEEFDKDIANPAFSNSALGRKYGVYGSTIKKWRDERFGTFKRMVDTWLNKSTAEMDFENILEELNLAYLYEKKIGKWKVDYSLGFNCLVEINGSHWHDEIQKTIEKDERKLRELNNMGYAVLVIWDYELKDKAAVKKKVLEALKVCADNYFKNIGSRNQVNIEKMVSSSKLG